MPTKHALHPPRPRAGSSNKVGEERYRLLRAAFQHAQEATLKGQYLEAIALLESILTDRLGCMVYGSLGQPVTLRNTLGDLIRVAVANVVVPRRAEENELARSRRREFPEDVVMFLETNVASWWRMRNDAVHGMAKIRTPGDLAFRDRYVGLQAVALRGFVVLLQLDAFDQRERKLNGAGRAATWPDAFATNRKLEALLFRIREAAS